MDEKEKIRKLEEEAEKIRGKVKDVLLAIETKLGGSHLALRQYIESKDFYKEVIEPLRKIARWDAEMEKAAENVAEKMSEAIGKESTVAGKRKILDGIVKTTIVLGGVALTIIGAKDLVKYFMNSGKGGGS